MDLPSFISRYPTLYHMAEEGAWPSIRRRGLLSTSALLDHLGVQGAMRQALESAHRPDKIRLGPPGAAVVLRDQKPMAPGRLAPALVDGSTPAQWYRFLNGRVFMWAQEHRLFGLLNARSYRTLSHDVLSIDTAALLQQHAAAVWLCPMNSGNTYPFPQARGLHVFQRIADYPSRPSTGRPVKEVVEVLVDHAVPDITRFVREVRRWRGGECFGSLPLQGD